MLIKIVEPLGIKTKDLNDILMPLTSMNHEVIVFDTMPKNQDELKERCSDADVIIIANTILTDETIKELKRLKMISVAFTGVDHIGQTYLSDRQIVLSNSAGYSDDSVAELVIALTLNLLRNIKSADEVVRNGGTIEGLIGNELRGKTVGIVGTGKIGKKTALLFKAFGCNLLGYDPYPSILGEEYGMEYVTLENLFESSDIVSLHLPLLENTRGLINKSLIGRMKSSSILINCSRGPIVDNVGLTEILNNNQIASAGIDVFDMEPPIPEDYSLLKAKNTLLTPHVAYATQESMIKRATIAVENVVAYLYGKPQNVILK